MPKLFAIITFVVLALLTVSITTLAQNKVETPSRVKVVMYEDIDNVCYITMSNNGISCLPRVRPMVASSSSIPSLPTRGMGKQAQDEMIASITNSLSALGSVSSVSSVQSINSSQVSSQ